MKSHHKGFVPIIILSIIVIALIIIAAFFYYKNKSSQLSPDQIFQESSSQLSINRNQIVYFRVFGQDRIQYSFGSGTNFAYKYQGLWHKAGTPDEEALDDCSVDTSVPEQYRPPCEDSAGKMYYVDSQGQSINYPISEAVTPTFLSQTTSQQDLATSTITAAVNAFVKQSWSSPDLHYGLGAIYKGDLNQDGYQDALVVGEGCGADCTDSIIYTVINGPVGLKVIDPFSNQTEGGQTNTSGNGWISGGADQDHISNISISNGKVTIATTGDVSKTFNYAWSNNQLVLNSFTFSSNGKLWQQYSSSQYGFSFLYPPTWKIIISPASSPGVSIVPADGNPPRDAVYIGQGNCQALLQEDSSINCLDLNQEKNGLVLSYNTSPSDVISSEVTDAVNEIAATVTLNTMVPTITSR